MKRTKGNIYCIFMLVLSMLLQMTATAQSPIRLSVRDTVPPDSADIEYYGRKHPVRAAAMVIGTNTALWAFDHYALKADYADISFKTIEKNIRKGFVWDNDGIETNMFAHPYNGNLYFNAARSNGFNFWESGLTALAGSALWELCMENEYPSSNDIIATPVGGMALGEVAYRSSDMLLDDSSRGLERVGREAVVFIISPMRGLTRLFTGDMWRVRETTGRQFGMPNLALEVSAGARVLGIGNDWADEVAGAAMQLSMEYGDRFKLQSSKPYDYFTARIDMAVQKSQPFLREVNITGRLLSREVLDNPKHQLSIGLYQHYDFYDSDTLSKSEAKIPYKVAVPASVGIGAMYRYRVPHAVAFDTYAHFNGVMIGGVLSDHYVLDERNYNLASGFSAKAGLRMALRNNKLSAQAEYDFYRLFTIGYPQGSDLAKADPDNFNYAGDQSAAWFGVAEVRVDYRLSRHFYLTGSWMHFARSTRYRDFPDVRDTSFSARLMLTYKI